MKCQDKIKARKSNLRLRSNVYLRRNSVSLEQDDAFVRQVRGTAVLKLLGMYGVPIAHRRHTDPEVLNLLRQGKLTQRQLNTIKWELRCVRCDCIPIGLSFEGSVDFRCDEQGCAQLKSSARSILVPDAVLTEYPPKTNRDQILAEAIRMCDGVPPDVTLEPPRTRLVVRVPNTLDWLYSDSDLSAFFTFGLKHWIRI